MSDEEKIKKPTAKKPVKIETPQSKYSSLLADAPVMVYEQADHLKNLRKKVGDLTRSSTREPKLPFGVLGLDLITQGGIHWKTVNEFYGRSKSGKTYLMCSVGAQAQRLYPDCVVVFYDRENALKVNRMAEAGLDMNRVIVIPASQTPEYQHLYASVQEISLEITQRHVKNAALHTEEEAKEIAKKHSTKGLICRPFALSSQPHIVLIVDSLSAFMGDFNDQGRRAKGLHELMRRVSALLDDKVLFLGSNHITDAVNNYGPTEKKSGGSAATFFGDVAIRLNELYYINNEHEVAIGRMIEATIKKTRDGAADLVVELPLFYHGGIPRYAGVLSLCASLGLCTLQNETAHKKSVTTIISNTEKENKGVKTVWKNYKFDGIAGSINESDSDMLRDFIVAHDILGKIEQAGKEYGILPQDVS